MNDRLHKNIYGQTLDEMKEDKGAWEYICDTCKHNDKEWDEEPCDGCCGNHSGYEQDKEIIRVDGCEYKSKQDKDYHEEAQWQNLGYDIEQLADDWNCTIECIAERANQLWEEKGEEE